MNFLNLATLQNHFQLQQPHPLLWYPNCQRRKSILKRSHPSLDGSRTLPLKERNCHDGGEQREKVLIWKNPLIHANKRQQAPVRVERRGEGQRQIGIRERHRSAKRPTAERWSRTLLRNCPPLISHRRNLSGLKLDF